MESNPAKRAFPFTVLATRDGLVLSTSRGQFLLRSGVDERNRIMDPVRMLNLTDSDPRRHELQLQDFKF